MFLKINSIFISVVLLMQGCASSTNDSSAIGQLVIAEPIAVSYKSEIALARLTEVIQRAEITDVQRAQLYYDRGVIYDSVGLRSLSRLDFNRALRLKPDLVDAYNFLGIQFTQLQEFTQAYDSFDSALDLSPNHEYAYLNRGIALYYGGRPVLAREDFQTFHQNQASDPYRLLWLYLAEYEIDAVQALLDLKERAELVEDTIWAKSIIQLYLGEVTQSSFIQTLTKNVTTNKQLSDRLCEAYFYLGKFNQLKGKDNVAANFFKLALSTNVYEFVEHRYAKLELDIMRENVKTNKP
ncbi:MAG: lipoprotein NlpI [Alteromonadaceae bacterium]